MNSQRHKKEVVKQPQTELEKLEKMMKQSPKTQEQTENLEVTEEQLIIGKFLKTFFKFGVCV